MSRQSISKAQKSNDSSLLPANNIMHRRGINRTDYATSTDKTQIPSRQQGEKPNRHASEYQFNQGFTKAPVRFNSHLLPIQAKLKIGQPNDKYEQEADRVAEQVMRMPDPQLTSSVADSALAKSTNPHNGTIQRTCATCSAEYKTAEEENRSVQPTSLCPKCRYQGQGMIQTKQISPLVQTKTTADATPEVTPTISSGIQSLQGGGRPLSDSERGFFEPRFGTDFSGVRVHDGARAAGVAQSINARAFTLGRDVVFGGGEYSSGSVAGRQLFAHELTHVVQQSVNTNRIQQQTASTANTCQQLTPQQIQNIIVVVNSGFTRMNNHLAHPNQLVGQQLSGNALRNIRRHINATISLAENFIRDLSSNNLSICIYPDPCPSSADACFNPGQNQILLRPRVLNPIDRFSVASFLHEYKHFKQHAAHAQSVVQNRRALIHTALEELSYEYEAALVGAIFTGVQITQQTQGSQESQQSPSGVLRERRGRGSGIEMFETAAPREVIEFALTHGNEVRPTSRDQLPVLNRSYTSQIGRNSPYIYYRVEWERNRNLTLFNLNGNRIPLGQFRREEIETGIPIKRAFWQSAEATTYEQGGYRIGVMIIHRNSSILKQIFVSSRPVSATTFRAEGSPIEEREIIAPGD